MITDSLHGRIYAFIFVNWHAFVPQNQQSHMKIELYVLFFFVLISTSCKGPRLTHGEKGWVLLGERKVSHFSDKDVFKIKSRDKFTAIRLYALERDIEIKRLEVTLVNGDVLKPSIESMIRKDERSRIIDLAADGRQLEKIVVVYSSEGKFLSHKGRVQIGGRPHNPNDNY